MKLKNGTIRIAGASFEICRTADGVVEILGDDDLNLATATGFVHAMDRLLQMTVVRLVGQGRVCECLKDCDENLAMDVFAREMGFYRDARDDAKHLTGDVLRFCENYCRGVNDYLLNHPYPWELRLVNYRPEPWVIADILLAMKLLFYIPIAQSQQDIEKLIIQAVQAGVDPCRLKQLFYPHLDGMNDELVRLIAKVKIGQPLLPPRAKFLRSMPAFVASNNWVVSGRRTASGKPIECHDPHVECNRLPALWYEHIQHAGNNFRIGMNMPGIPGMLMGRTREISFSLTYGYMDMVDYYIEEVRNNRVRRRDNFEDLSVREEVIHRKRNPDIKLKVWKSRHGVLEAEPYAETLEDGYYLCRAWSGERDGAGQSIGALHDILKARTVPEAQPILAKISGSCNWLIADSQGNIGYQQSGRLPVRAHSGLHPVPGWEERYDWQNFVRFDRLARTMNPVEGYIATANNECDSKGYAPSINLSVGPYRADRIKALLAEDRVFTTDDMKRMQRDLHSLQAIQFLSVLLPFVPEGPTGRLLQEWDCRYNKDSRAASLFEEIYRELLEEIFGRCLFGLEAWRQIVAETAILTHFYYVFDKALLGEDTIWFENKGRAATVRDVVERVLNRYPDPAMVPTWGSQQRITMTNLFFDGKVPRFLRFDHGPIVVEGGRATIVQGAVYKFRGRTTSLSPSYRFITDLADSFAHTALAGGSSDRRYSKYYRAGIGGWQRYEYKTLDGEV